MQFRLSSLLPVAALAAVVAAAPSELSARQDSSECDTGSIQCCQTTYQSDSEQATSLFGLLGIVLDDLVGLVGVGCSSSSLVGVGGGSSCTQQPVCCNGNTFNGLIVIGCSPININL